MAYHGKPRRSLANILAVKLKTRQAQILPPIMKYFQILATVACLLLGWIGYELHSISRQAGSVDVTASVGVSGGLNVDPSRSAFKVEINR